MICGRRSASSQFRSLRHAAQRQIVAFRRAAGEDNFARLRTDGRGDRFPRRIDRLACFPTVAMARAAGVAVLLAEIRQHRLQHARIDPRGGVVVHVNRQVASHRASCATVPVGRIELGAWQIDYPNSACKTKLRPRFEPIQIGQQFGHRAKAGSREVRFRAA